MLRVTLLGCGASTGVPSLSDGWGGCDPDEPRNRRRRASLLVEKQGYRLLIDASPDLRQQLLDAAVDRLGAVLLTHAHADHLHGLDDLRPLTWRSGERLPVHADRQTWAETRRRFGYLFDAAPESPAHFVPPLTAHEIMPAGTFRAGPLHLATAPQDHGSGGTSLGVVVDGRVAYSTDVWRFTPAELKRLAALRLELWILGCLSPSPIRSHAHFDLVLDWIRAVRPRRAVLTHMNNRMDYCRVLAACPAGVEPGHDGLSVTLP